MNPIFNSLISFYLKVNRNNDRRPLTDDHSKLTDDHGPPSAVLHLLSHKREPLSCRIRGTSLRSPWAWRNRGRCIRKMPLTFFIFPFVDRPRWCPCLFRHVPPLAKFAGCPIFVNEAYYLFSGDMSVRLSSSNYSSNYTARTSSNQALTFFQRGVFTFFATFSPFFDPFPRVYHAGMIIGFHVAIFIHAHAKRISHDFWRALFHLAGRPRDNFFRSDPWRLDTLLAWSSTCMKQYRNEKREDLSHLITS